MMKRELGCAHRSERGQSVVVMAVGLAALLLVVAGVAFAGVALVTSNTMAHPQGGGVLFGMIEARDVTEVMEEALPRPTATPGLGAIVGNQVYLVDPQGVNTLAEGNAP